MQTTLSTLVKMQLLFLLFFIVGCKKGTDKQHNEFQTYKGEVFGTYYRVKIDSRKDFTGEIDSIFKAINKAANSYVGDSEITDLNNRGFLENPSPTFLSMLRDALRFQKITDGYFEPALYPIIKVWRFENEGAKATVDSVTLEGLKTLIPLEKVVTVGDTLVKTTIDGVKIDLSAMGEGYAIESIHKVFEKERVSNYLIEIGGEIFAKGHNEKGEIWTIGIENPAKAAVSGYENIITKLKLKGEGISTSGSYRKFYTDREGHKYPHIIDPKTGYPVKHHLVSASIKAESPLTADALATACIAMGTEKAKKMIEEQDGVEGFLSFYVKDSIVTWNSEKFYE